MKIIEKQRNLIQNNGNQWKWKKTMKFNTKTIKIKQGYYNYQYLLLDNYTNTSSSNIFEGSHYQTTNDYYIYVYFKKPESRYTRLVGYKKISSKNLL